MEATNELIDEHRGLVFKSFYQFFPHKNQKLIDNRLSDQGFTQEDLIQEGMLALTKSLQNYKDDRNSKFSTYAYQQIYFAMMNKLNRDHLIRYPREMPYEDKYKKTREETHSLNATMGDREEDTFLNYLSFRKDDISYNLSNLEIKNAVYKAISQLDRESQYVVTKRLSGFTEPEISKEINKSIRQINYIYKKSLIRLRELLEGYREYLV